MKRLLTFAALALAVTSACAADFGTKPQMNGPIKVDFVRQVVQNPGESKAEFINRTAVFLDNWVRENKEEACGQIASNADGNLSVVLVTVHSHAACGEPAGAVVEGYKWMGETIHVHPYFRSYVVSDADQRMGDGEIGRRIAIEPAHFSHMDYASGPGYLVTGGKLLYQNGVGTSKVVEESVNNEVAQR
jgi:hypothetical protein